ncbi:MAG: hypothetical protein IIY02_02845 [Firmicutes bacterium]|nr:hypothetical protein [Bacillota bacterium]
MRHSLRCFLYFLAVTTVFVALNNVPRIPPEAIRSLWYAYLPLLALTTGFARGKAQKKSGTTVPILALFLLPLLWLGAKCAMPFASTFLNLPVLLAAIPCAILGEIKGRPI